MALKLGKKAAKSETTVHGGVSTFARAKPLDILYETPRPFSTMFVATQLGI